MRKLRAHHVAPWLLALALPRCGDEDADVPPDQQCEIFANELCAALAYCSSQPPSELRDYADICKFAQSVYTSCTPVPGPRFDLCIQSIHDAPCPAAGRPLNVAPACEPLSQPK